jgi:negative regulator of sigma-B (phosphoserine phosphatase)
MKGEVVSGDLHIVRRSAKGVLLAVVDGAGHGDAAAAAAKAAASILEQHLDATLTWLLEFCHAALKETRGAVMTLAALDEEQNTLTWLGVGNVEGRLFRANHFRYGEHLMLGAGIVGYRLPPLRPVITPISAGDMLILTTDGIENEYNDSGYLNESPLYVADYILNRFSKGTDDALVLAARYTGVRS